MYAVLKRHLERSPKLVGPVPAGFGEAFNEYQQRYAEKVSDEKYSIDINIHSILEQIEDGALPSVVPTHQAVDDPTEARTEEDQEGVLWTTIPGESEKRFVIEDFYPEVDDAYVEFARVISYARDRFESAMMGGYDEPRLMNIFSKGVGPFDYYSGTIGVDLEGITRRWKQVPHIFVPRHVSAAYGRSERGSLFHLLNDAVRAYVFGVPLAAIVMCRAVCEMVHKKHYGRAKDEWSSLVEELDLGQKKNLADTVIHNYAHRHKITEDDEKVILDYLESAKTVIERAPAAGENRTTRPGGSA
ncbi:MAG: hypothetical protein IH906_08665 [Proteobacteria bacterium]|nr:hypothetical protein [Pseudomonadota bacterium]